MHPQDKDPPSYATTSAAPRKDKESEMDRETLAHNISILQAEMEYLKTLTARDKYDQKTVDAIYQSCHDIRDRTMAIEVYGVEKSSK